MTQGFPVGLEGTLKELYKEAYADLSEYAYLEDLEKYFQWMQKRSSRGFVLVSLEDKLSGFTAVDSGEAFVGGGDCEILELVVSPACRKQGIASRLVQESVNVLRERGCKRIGIEIGINNYKSKNLFLSRFGFQFYRRYDIWDEYYKYL